MTEVVNNNQSNNTNDSSKSNKKVIYWLIISLSLSFAFSYALVPLYNTFCKITGLNGKTDGRYQVEYATTVDPTRSIKVQFTTNLNKHLPWEFKPSIRSVTVHPGEKKQVTFYIKNLSDKTIVGRAIPSITPGIVARQMHKTECFCFGEQVLKPGESMLMPLVFFLDKKFPKDINEMTLSYTFFDTQKMSQKFTQTEQS